MGPTKENLCRWRQQGMSNAEIAFMIEKSASTVNRLFSSYKIKKQSRSIPEDAAKAFVRNREETVITVQEPKLPEMFIMAPKREPKAVKIVVNGHRYIDITDFVIQW